MNKNTLYKIGGGIGIVIILVGIYWWQRGDSRLVQPQSNQQDVIENRATNALKAVVDVANELSGITSSAVFNFELVDMDGKSANFGIVKYDGMRGEPIVEEHMIIFEEVASRENPVLTNNTAEVDFVTNKVVAMHRTPSQNHGGDKSPDELEETARQFIKRVYPEFSESTLKFNPGMKGVRLNNGNYFFRWDDEQFAVPKGLEMDVSPFIQVGITASGYIFGYNNTVGLYHNLSKEALRAICAFVEMPQTDDSLLNKEKGIVAVWFSEYEPFRNRYVILPFEPETDFAGCSESAKEWLRHLPNDSDKN